MEYYTSILIFAFGIITWIPFLKTPYGQDQAGSSYYVDQVLKRKITFFKDIPVYTIGHYLHLIVLQFFVGKENKYYNRLMCLWCSLSAFIVYWIVYDLCGLSAAMIAGILYALYIVNPRIDGNWGPFETILALPLLASLCLILQSSKTDSHLLIALSGLFFGYSILVKQTAVLYLPGYLLIMMGLNSTLTSFFIFGGGVFVSNLIPLIYYLKRGAFWEYLACNWLMMFPSAINPKKYNKFYPRGFVRGEIHKKAKKKIILKNSSSMFPLMFLTIITLITFINNSFSIIYCGLFACLIASVWMVFMRGTFFPHYWLYMVPWFVILASYSLSEMVSTLNVLPHFNIIQWCSTLVVFGLFFYAVCIDYKFYIPHKDPYGFLKKFYGEEFTKVNYENPIKIAKYIKNSSNPDDKILICGWSPYLYLYSEMDTFCLEPGICLYAEDYLEIYNRSNPALLDFLNSIYKFKNFKIIKQRENVFKSGFPEIIVLSDGRGDIKDFEKLSGVCYARDENLKGYPLFRADEELTKLMSFFEKTNNKSIQKRIEINSKENVALDNLDPQDWDSTLEISKQLLAKDPYKIEHLLILGECLIRSGNYRLLFRFYNRIIEKQMVSTTYRIDLLGKLGEAYCHQDKFKEAEGIFVNILKLKPGSPMVLNNLGFVYSRQGNNEKASLCFQKALELDPENEDAMMNLEQIKALW
ncbi:MAG: tetratricopeptide repeat protein [Candidatus Scalindua sp.]|nr:tetratricopeptide repeat protein [Candidatus Scalindua sp.]